MDTLLASKAVIRSRIAQLRTALVNARLDALLVPSSDPHLSEYLPPRWKGREYLSGFTGSVGTLIVTADFAGVWTDSRYWVQAEAELAGSGIVLMKIPTGASLLHLDWLAANLKPGQTLGVDGAVLGLSTARLLAQSAECAKAVLRTDVDLLNDIWPERPALPEAPIYEHQAPYAVTPRAEKLAALRAAMQAQGAHWHCISTLDDLAYLFNLRGADVNYNPVFLAHALIGMQRATLFVPEGKVSPALRAT